VEPLDGISQWYRRLWQGPAFRAAAAARWAGLRRGSLADSWFVEEIGRVRGRGAVGRQTHLLCAHASLASFALPTRPLGAAALRLPAV
jgi:hypothetical protein